MRQGLCQRLIQGAALAAVVLLGAWAYTRSARPDRTVLVRYAEARLRAIFGAHVTWAAGKGEPGDSRPVDVHPLRGVTIRGLAVRGRPGEAPTLRAEEVVIRHDVIALAAGAYVPERIEIRGARLDFAETTTGIVPDFPFHLSGRDTEGRVPTIRVEDAQVRLRARPGSTRLAEGAVVAFGVPWLDVQPLGVDRMRVEGELVPRDLGQAGPQGTGETRIPLTGFAFLDQDRLQLTAVWEPLVVSPALLAVLAPTVAARLGERQPDSSRLLIVLDRDGRFPQGEVSLTVDWTSSQPMEQALDALPPEALVDARTREQLLALFERAEIGLSIRSGDTETINLGRLVSGLGEGQVEASGTLSSDGAAMDILVRIRGVRFEEPAIREALGPEGRQVYEAFDPSGALWGDIRITRRAGQEAAWEADARIEDGTFRYVGPPAPPGQARGFPFAMEQATGRIRFSNDLVRFDDIEGFNGSASVRIRGNHRRAWTGGETGRIRLTDEGADIRLTVEATDVPVDEALERAVRGSDLASLLERFQVEGELDSILVDVIRIPGFDAAAVTEVRLEIEDERFRYADFPVLLESVRGTTTLRRPPLPGGGRGEVVRVDIVGRVEDRDVAIEADVDLAARRGRVRIAADDIPLEGLVARTVADAPLTRGSLAAVWRYLAPRGRADVRADLPLESDPGPLRFEVTLHDASIRLDAQRALRPLVLTDLEGRLVVTGDRVEVLDVRGRLGRAPVTVAGTLDGGPAGRWDLCVESEALAVDGDLLATLAHYAGQDTLLPGGLSLEPGAQVALGVRLRKEAGEDAPVTARVETRAVEARLGLPGGTRLAVRGRRIVVEGDRVTLEDLQGEAEGIRVEVQGVTVGGGDLVGGFTLGLDAFVLGDEVLGWVPEGARLVLARVLEKRVVSSDRLDVRAEPDGRLHLTGALRLHATAGGADEAGPQGVVDMRPLLLTPSSVRGEPTLSGRLVLRDVDLGADLPLSALDGEVDLTALSLGADVGGRFTLRASRARLFGVRARDLVVPVAWADGILELGPLTGVVAQGRLTGAGRVHVLAPVAYEGRIAVDDFRVEALQADLAPQGPPWTGRGRAWVRLENRGGRVEDLVAEGHVSIRDGDLGDLPGGANLEALVAQILRAPNPPRFERAHADFTLQDEVLAFHRLDLAGPLFDLPGRGTVDLDGVADLTFSPHLLKSLLLPGSMQLPGVSSVLDVLLPEDLLYGIRLRGDLATARPEVVALPRARRDGTPPFEGTGVPEAPPARIPRWFR